MIEASRIDLADIPNSQSYGTRYLYVVSEEWSSIPVKIGRADNPIWRVSSLQAGNFRDLSLMAAWVGRRSDITQLELQIHAHFADLRIAREWFRVSVNDVADAVARACR